MRHLASGIAPPGAGARARRVDQHQIAASFEIGEHVRLTPRRAHLDIAGARAGEPGEDRRKAMRVGVGGVDLSLVLHRGGERQRLAARAGAKVEDLHAGLGFREQRGKLRALVLQLDVAFDISRIGGERRRAAVRAHGDAQAHGRERRRLGLEMGERAERFVAIGLEKVHAQIDGRALGERPALLRSGGAEARLELGAKPFGEIPDNVRGRA